MPTYEYRCDACGHEFELFQSMTDSVKRKCPKCGKPKLQRLIGTGAGIIFKGGGFYQTDYRSDNYKKAAESDKKSTQPAKETTAAKSDAKADTPASSSEITPKKNTSKRKKPASD
jgi:putative FmdB family regulatory protein